MIKIFRLAFYFIFLVSDYSKMEKVQSNRRVEQAQNMNNLFFTNGHSASVAKLISAFLGDTFKTEAKAAYTAFQVSST